MKIAVPLMLLLLVVATLNGQTSRRRSAPRPAPKRAASTQPTPQPTPSEIKAPDKQYPPRSLVVVNGLTLTTADLDADLRQQVDTMESEITAARLKVLDLQINTLLLQAEASKRHLTSQQLYDTEVTKRITTPTTAEVKKLVDENRAQFGGEDEKELSVSATAFLTSQQEAKLTDELVRKLRATTPVVMGVDVNAPNLNPTSVVATVGGRPILAGVIIERLKPIAYNIRLNAYEAARARAERMVDDILLIGEANRRQIGPEEIIRTEISDKIHRPTEADVTKFYTENKAQINGNLESVRTELVTYLQEQDQQRLEKTLSEKLRKTAKIQWLISEPEQPVQSISVDDDPARGDVNAPITIVEFTDFQCPACAAMQPVLENVLKSYGNRIRFVVRDFPLSQHANAKRAAEAADAANAQGKFFEYTALLFTRQNALDVASLKKYATELGLNRARFDAELDGGMYAAEVRHDVEDAEIYGVQSTPTIFINGVMLRTLSAEGVRAAIERAAAARAAATPR
ncbi:MAG: DsbA family protein [Pyrinomonadaceae bacterium]